VAQSFAMEKQLHAPVCVSVAIVAAHPDDEMIGLGALLSSLPAAHAEECSASYALIHVTDGAPRSEHDARNAGCPTWKEYAALRRREFEKALDACGINDAVTLCLDCPDQQAVFRIAANAIQLAAILGQFHPSVVFTHAYEGGHPDHDATAAAVHAAICLLKSPCALVEFAGYHAGPYGIECECFLDKTADVVERPLTISESRQKRDLLNCFASQSRVLAQFPLKDEPLRPAPQYDFARPPHAGPLYYERFDWAVDPAQWRALTGRAFRDLGIPCVC
jgi:LmbE family N-acetylglucosaminyl deacetylase